MNWPFVGDPVNELVLFKNYRPDRAATFDEYRASGGYETLTSVLRKGSREQLKEVIKASGLRGRGGAGFPTGMKWNAVRQDAPFPRYIVSNADEMEPGTFKDRVLMGVDPHLVIEGLVLAAYAVSAEKGFMFIRPSYEEDAQVLDRELAAARDAGFLGKNILGSDFSCDLTIHRSGGRYICGEVSAQIKAIEGKRPHPQKGGPFETEKGIWGLPTLMNNVETLACVPHIVKNGPAWFKGLAKSKSGAGTKLYCVTGMVNQPGCFELPIGTRLSEIIDEHAGGMKPGTRFKTCLPGGASTRYLTPEHYHVEMDFDAMQEVGHRLGTAAVIVFDENTCLVASTLNLMEFFARESCGWCTPCREGIPFIRDLLWRIENGEGKEVFIPMLREMARHMSKAYCAFAPGAASPVESLLTNFENEIREHISQRKCPFRS